MIHGGDDYPAPTGTPVFASAKGTQRVAGWQHGYGNVVYLDHPGGWQTIYAHLDVIGNRRVGKQWDEGEVIGWVGSTGYSTRSHLHFECRLNGKKVPPERWFEENGVPVDTIALLQKQVNAIFRSVYEKEPTTDDNEYWLRRVGHPDPNIAINTEKEMRDKMGYYKSKGITRGGRFW